MYISFLNPSIWPVNEIEVLKYCGLYPGIEGYFAGALLDFLKEDEWRAFVLVQCGNFDILLLETNTCCFL